MAYLDAMFLPVIRGESEKEPVYVALGVRLDGTREILGYWLCSGGESSFAWESRSKLSEFLPRHPCIRKGNHA